MIRTLALASLVAACGGAHGVSLEVTAFGDIATVELMIAPDLCELTLDASQCDRGLAWDTAKGKTDGDVFIVSRDEVLVADVGADGVARFLLEGTAGETNASRIGIVGYRADGTAAGMAMLHDTSVPVHRAEIWRVALRPVPDLGDGTKTDGERFHVWQARAATEQKCLAYEYIDGGKPQFEFLVPASDSDCDGATPECDDFFWNYKPAGEAANCLTRGPEHVMTCEIGNRVCADGIGSNACMQLSNEICATDNVCMKCAGGLTGTCLQNAVTDAFLVSSTPTPALECAFQADAQGAPCTGGESVRIDVLEDYMRAIGSSCDTAEVIVPAVPLPNGSDKWTLGPAMLSLAKVTEAGQVCTFSLTWTGTKPPSDVPPVFISFRAHNGNFMLAPFRVLFVPNMQCLVSTTPCIARNFPLPMGTVSNVFACAI